jgi:hypothetical protein
MGLVCNPGTPKYQPCIHASGHTLYIESVGSSRTGVRAGARAATSTGAFSSLVNMKESFNQQENKPRVTTSRKFQHG